MIDEEFRYKNHLPSNKLLGDVGGFALQYFHLPTVYFGLYLVLVDQPSKCFTISKHDWPWPLYFYLHLNDPVEEGKQAMWRIWGPLSDISISIFHSTVVQSANVYLDSWAICTFVNSSLNKSFPWWKCLVRNKWVFKKILRHKTALATWLLHPFTVF